MRRALLSIVLTAGVMLSVDTAGQEREVSFTPRLPLYYAAIVTPSQRKEIYAVQQRYAQESADLKDKLAQLKSQLDELTGKRDAEIEAVLNAQQRKQLQAAREAAAAKRKKGQ